jgi:hypothetical protein
MASRLIIGALLLVTTCTATEKYWIVHEARLIVVGTLHPHPEFIFPWFDGWHIDGTIDVDEVVFGTKPPGPIKYVWTCKYSMCRDWRAIFAYRRLPADMKEKGIWFLKPLDDHTWQPSLYLGYVDLSERADYLSHLPR